MVGEDAGETRDEARLPDPSPAYGRDLRHHAPSISPRPPLSRRHGTRGSRVRHGSTGAAVKGSFRGAGATAQKKPLCLGASPAGFRESRATPR